MLHLLVILLIIFLLFKSKYAKIFRLIFVGFLGLIVAAIISLLDLIFGGKISRGIRENMRKFAGSASWSAHNFAHENTAASADVAQFYAQLIAHIAKLDGTISQIEARWISEELSRIAQNPAHRAQIKQIFNEAKNRPHEYAATAQKLLELGISMRQRNDMLSSLLQLALLDGLNSAKVDAIVKIGEIWGMKSAVLAALEQLGIRSSGGGYARANSSLSREEALARLGLANGASAEEIKRAYRRIARECHPDTLGAQNLSEREREAKIEQFKKAVEAYELLKK